MNVDSPVYAELAALVRKTGGLADVLRAALLPLAADIELAYIYGSQAAGTARPDSDVDVMVVGRAGSDDVYEALERSAETLGRAVNPTVYPADEYWSKVRRQRGFPYTAHSGPRIMLVGDGNEPV
jgi:predicted nucleotidyltransferase